MSRILIIGAGGYGRAVAEAILAARQQTVVGFADDRWPDLASVGDLPVLGRLGDLPHMRQQLDAVVVAIGERSARRAAFEAAAALGLDLPCIVHPHAIVSPSAQLGSGVTIMAGAIVATEARIEEGALVNAGAVIDHHARVGAFAYVGAGARMAGGSALPAGAWLRAGDTLLPGQIAIA